MPQVLSYSNTGGFQNQEVAAIGTVVAAAGGGLAITAGEVALAATIAGNGLSNTGGVLAVVLPGRGAPVAITTAGAGTLTAAAIVAGVIMRSGPVGAYNDTTATAAQIIALLDSPADGDSFDFTIVNGVAQVGTMVAGTDITLAGVTANAASKVRKYRCTITSVANHTATITGIGEMVA
jgi:hypothetical protein